MECVVISIFDELAFYSCNVMTPIYTVSNELDDALHHDIVKQLAGSKWKLYN